MKNRITSFHGICLIIVMLTGFAIRLLFIGRDSLWPDEALYLFISQNLISDPLALRDPSGQWFYQNPPMYTYMLAGVFKLTGVSLTAAQFFSIALGSATIGLTYFIGRSIFKPSVGLVGAILLAVSPLHMWMSTRILIDVPLTFFIYLAIFMLIKEKKILFFTFSLAAISLKYPAVPILLLPFLNESRLKKRPYLFISLYFIGLVMIIIIFSVLPNLTWDNKPLAYFMSAFGLPDFAHMFRETYYFLGIVFIFFMIGLIGALKKGNLSVLVIWVVLFGTARIFMAWGAFRMSRYTLPLYPALLILAAHGGFFLYEYVKRRLPQSNPAVTTVFAALLFFIVSISAFRAYTVTETNIKTFNGFSEVQQFFSDRPSDFIVAILTSSPRQVKFMVPEMTVHDLPMKSTPSEARDIIREKNISYVIIDRWSPHQPGWAIDYFQTANGFQPVHQTADLKILKIIQ